MAEFPDIIACVSCDIALFLNEEEQTSGVFSCPHCKHDHNLGEIQPVDEPSADPVEEESEPPSAEPSEPELPVGDPVEEALFFDDAVVKKRKPINFKALLPYAAVFVFGVALNYAVIWVTGYLQEQKAHKAQWVIWLKADQTEMKERPEVYHDALEDGKNKEAFGRLGEMSLDELKAFRGRLIKGRKDSYDNWFQDTGDKITTNSVYGPVVQGFQRKLNRFIRRVKLAKIDAGNLETAFGMNSFERRKTHALLNAHVVSIREQMDALSTDKAIEQGLVRAEVLSALMEMSLEVDNFQMKSVKQIVVH